MIAAASLVPSTLSKGAPRPFLKWAGGKRQLLPELRKHLPAVFGHYYEPFIGGGALFFDLRASGWKGAATLGDANTRLVRTYLGVRNDVEAVIACLKGMEYDKTEYLERRAHLIDGCENAEVAAWFIYLNRCGFNGLYRVNSKGVFNVPFGDYTNPLICDAEGLRLVAKALKKTRFLIGDFEKTARSVETGDLVYFDPPYVPVSVTSDFTGYTRDGFTIDDQTRLRDAALRLKRLGVHVILSNADMPVVRRLYARSLGFRVHRVDARRAINSKPGGRGSVGELIIT